MEAKQDKWQLVSFNRVRPCDMWNVTWVDLNGNFDSYIDILLDCV